MANHDYPDSGLAPFDQWWKERGSTLIPFVNATPEEHAHRVAFLAWAAALHHLSVPTIDDIIK